MNTNSFLLSQRKLLLYGLAACQVRKAKRSGMSKMSDDNIYPE